MALPYRLPSMPLAISIWRFSNWAGVIPPANAADVESIANLTPGRRVFEQSIAPMSYLLLDKTTDIRFTESGIWSTWPAADPDLVEVPTGSARFYIVADVEGVGMGFANEHLEAAITKQSPWSGATPPFGGSILLEDGTSLLLEDATDYLLE